MDSEKDWYYITITLRKSTYNALKMYKNKKDGTYNEIIESLLKNAINEVNKIPKTQRKTIKNIEN